MGNNKGSKIKEAAFLDAVPVPACVVDPEGVVVYANPLIKEVFAYNDIVDSNFFALTGIRREELEAAAGREDDEETGSGEEIRISRSEQVFALNTNRNPGQGERMVVYFQNVTEREALRSTCQGEQICLLYINIDNYDELISSIAVESRRAVPTEVDHILRAWAEQYDAALESTGEDSYSMTVYHRNAEAIIESKFAVLDEVRSIVARIDFPVSISIGMGMGAATLRELTELADAALELALGRGGDQAVVKDGDRTHYYGGRLQSMEKNNKGKSRVIAHALKQLILDSRNVLIMGHRWPDMDCFGSALGAYRIARFLDRDAAIVIGEYNDALREIYTQAKSTEEYDIVTREKALALCDKDSLLIVVDTHRPGIIECPELLHMTDKVVVIDHHRLAEDAIENPTLAYVESYASSASELIAEILQYIASKRIINKFEAEALLAGITVDTNSYSIKTGVRTFEAAAWLRRAGADTTEVKRFFQTEIKAFQTKATAIAGAEYLDCGVALSMAEGCSTEAQTINAKVADELLMVKGVRASFAVGRNDRGQTVISARSLGEINVQLIMEQFNGGGHLNSAGAQVDLSPEEVIEAIKELLPKAEAEGTAAGE